VTRAVAGGCRHAGLDPASSGGGLRLRGRSDGGSVCVMPARCRHAGPDPASSGDGLRVKPGVTEAHRSDGVMPRRCRHAGLDPASSGGGLRQGFIHEWHEWARRVSADRLAAVDSGSRAGVTEAHAYVMPDLIRHPAAGGCSGSIEEALRVQACR
jgi:hypothetical protein